MLLEYHKEILQGGVKSMVEERRGGVSPIPDDLKEVLNEAQLATLNKMEGFGWELKFIRRPLFQGIVPVLLHPDSDKKGILEDDGTLNLQSDTKIRE